MEGRGWDVEGWGGRGSGSKSRGEWEWGGRESYWHESHAGSNSSSNKSNSGGYCKTPDKALTGKTGSSLSLSCSANSALRDFFVLFCLFFSLSLSTFSLSFPFMEKRLTRDDRESI